MVTLDEIAQLLYGNDGETSGWTGSQEDLISLAGKVFPGKAFCVVRQWILIDLTVTPEELEKLTNLGLLPMTLFAHEVVLDSGGRFQPGMWVRSNFGVSFIYGSMFETKNTVYLLWGPGQRKEATVGAAFSMSAG
ncbi:hypothetical protein EQV97_17235 [Pseudomonas sp. TMW22090]|uniref:DUF6957 family protein n=1 Tax=Pseudomonas sp. TMW22090 TaxID=2506434 RepID=UPI001F0D4A22|nr:hypothetical protein [Pseudomonas sp. TMW22090]MCH4879118.1 hypothetical protein [Pseudomonas sp. TMW22090]